MIQQRNVALLYGGTHVYEVHCVFIPGEQSHYLTGELNIGDYLIRLYIYIYNHIMIKIA